MHHFVQLCRRWGGGGLLEGQSEFDPPNWKKQFYLKQNPLHIFPSDVYNIYMHAGASLAASKVVVLMCLLAPLAEQVLYVFRQPYESGGLLWRKAVTQVLTAVYIFQLLMLALLGIKKFPYAPIIVPAIIATYVYHR